MFNYPLKKLFSILIATTLILSSYLTPATASGTCYVVVGTVLTDGKACTGAIVIDNSVTSIGREAFDGNTALTSVTIGNRVTSIGIRAFQDNTALTSVTIPDSVLTIGQEAFDGNTALTSVTIGNSVETIGTRAFQDNTALTSVTIPDSVLTIGQEAFDRNTALTSVTIGNSVETIGTRAFKGNTALSSVTIPDSVLTIDQEAFDGNTLLGSVTFLGNAPTLVGLTVFRNVAAGATANVAYSATGFPAAGELWNGLIVVYSSAPVIDSGSSSTPSPNIITPALTPVVAQVADSTIKLKKKTYVSKKTMKIKLRKNKLFKYSANDRFKYKILKSSRNSCGMRGNYVMRYKNSKVCDLQITRTNAKGISNKYWVKINYLK
jgi:hypothetical protein